MAKFDFLPAFVLTVDDRKEVDVAVTFTDGVPTDVTFKDAERGAMVSVPFDLWSRVIAAVERTADMNTSGGAA